jgi:putative endonuclease
MHKVINSSSDVLRRLDEHNNPVESPKYTAKGIAWSLVLSFEISHSRGDAMRVEKFIKKQKTRSLI